VTCDVLRHFSGDESFMTGPDEEPSVIHAVVGFDVTVIGRGTRVKSISGNGAGSKL